MGCRNLHFNWGGRQNRARRSVHTLRGRINKICISRERGEKWLVVFLCLLCFIFEHCNEKPWSLWLFSHQIAAAKRHLCFEQVVLLKSGIKLGTAAKSYFFFLISRCNWKKTVVMKTIECACCTTLHGIFSVEIQIAHVPCAYHLSGESRPVATVGHKGAGPYQSFVIFLKSALGIGVKPVTSLVPVRGGISFPLPPSSASFPLHFASCKK